MLPRTGGETFQFCSLIGGRQLNVFFVCTMLGDLACSSLSHPEMFPLLIYPSASLCDLSATRPVIEAWNEESHLRCHLNGLHFHTRLSSTLCLPDKQDSGIFLLQEPGSCQTFPDLGLDRGVLWTGGDVLARFSGSDSRGV